MSDRKTLQGEAFTVNCTLPVPEGLFRLDDNKCYTPNDLKSLQAQVNLDDCEGNCTKVGVTPACLAPNAEVASSQLCSFKCFDGNFGSSTAVCSNGTWVPWTSDFDPSGGAFPNTCSEYMFMAPWGALPWACCPQS